jgi:transposase InsO family protein
MRELGMEGVIRGQRRRTTVPEPSAPRPPDLVDRDFTASRPDQLWVADMTYVRTWSGWVYVAFVLDVFSRMMVGWQVANHMRTELPLDALGRDIPRGPEPAVPAQGRQRGPASFGHPPRPAGTVVRQHADQHHLRLQTNPAQNLINN